MIISVKEVQKIKEIIAEVKEELKSEGIPYKEDVELGIMIETPASVMVSRELAKEVDFFQCRDERSDSVYTGHRPSEFQT